MQLFIPWSKYFLLRVQDKIAQSRTNHSELADNVSDMIILSEQSILNLTNLS